MDYIEKNNLMEPNQSAYRRNHSTETTLLKVKSDILLAMDKQHITCLCLLDLSAAYDTIELSTLLTRLEKDLASLEQHISWIRSYVTNRTQKVIIGDLNQDGVMSQSVSITSGIPQGSVLGPILFTLYTVPLGDICRSHRIEFQLYADDQQNYLTFKPIKGNT